MEDCLGDMEGSGEGAGGGTERSTEERRCRWTVLGEPEIGSWGACKGEDIITLGLGACARMGRAQISKKGPGALGICGEEIWKAGGWGKPGPREGSWVREQDSPESGALCHLTTSTWGQPSPAGRMVVTVGGLAPSQLPAPASGCWCLELPKASQAASARALGSARLGFESERSHSLAV